MNSEIVVERHGPAPRGRSQGATRNRDRLISTATIVTMLAVWETLAQLELIDTRILAAPSTVVAMLIELWQEGELTTALTATTQRFAIGFFLGAIPGLMLGVTIGLFRWARLVLEPLVSVFYMLPRIAMFPIVLIFLGLNEKSNIVMISLAPFFTVAITTIAAVRNIDPIYQDVAKSFDTRTKDLYFRITMPAALPVIFSGLRVALGLALVTTVAVEFLVATEGIGALIWRSWQILSMSLSLAGLVAAAVLGLIAYGLLGGLERALVPWKRL